MATKKAPVKKKVVAKKVTVKKPAKKVAKKSASTCTCHDVCRPGESFWVNYGPVVDSIAVLRDSIETMSDEQYAYHTKRGSNDFASWIRHCFGNEKVAGRVEKATTKAATLKALATCCK